MSFEKLRNFLGTLFEDEMNGGESTTFQFNSFLLDVDERRLYRDETPISLTPKVFDVLVYLVSNSGHLVLKEELMTAVWADSFIDEVNIPRTIHTIRKALGENVGGERFIETVPTKGYRFVADVKRKHSDAFHSSSLEHVSEIGTAQSVLDSQASTRSLHKSLERKSSRKTVLVVSVVGLLLLVAGSSISSRYLRSESTEKGVIPETFSGEALQNYNQGRFLVERRHKGDYEKALEYFEKAIELDPNYSNAHAGKADVKIVRFWGSGKHEDIISARTAVNRAIAINDRNSYARAVYCRILTTYDWNHAEAEKECRRAVELNPNDHEAQKELAFFLHAMGKDDEALAAINNAIQIAPSSFNKRSRGMILYQLRQYDEAIKELEQVEETDPLYVEASRWLSRAYHQKGDFSRAVAYYIRLTQFSGGSADEVAAIKTLFETEGWTAVLRNMADSKYMRTLFRAGSLAELGEKDLAFATLEEMSVNRAVLLVTIAREPTLDPLRNDPRFNNLLKRVGLNR